MKRLFLLSCMAACMAAVTSWPGPFLAMEEEDRYAYNLIGTKKITLTSNQTDKPPITLKEMGNTTTDDDGCSEALRALQFEGQSAKTYATSHYIDGRNVASAKNTSKKTAKKRSKSTCWKGFLKYCCSCCYKTKTQLDSSDSDSDNTLLNKNRDYRAQGSVNNAVSLLENTNPNQVTITEMGHDHGQQFSYAYESLSTQKVQEGNPGASIFNSVISPERYSAKQSEKSFQSSPKTSNLTLISSESLSQEQGKGQKGANRYAGVPADPGEKPYMYGQRTNLSSAQGSAFRGHNPLSSSSVNEEIEPESTQEGEHETQFEFINHSTDATELKTGRTYEDRKQTIKGALRRSKEVLEFNKSQRRQVQTDAINGVPTVTIGAQEFHNPEPLTPNQKALLQIPSDGLSESEFGIADILEENLTTWQKIKRCCCS